MAGGKIYCPHPKKSKSKAKRKAAYAKNTVILSQGPISTRTVAKLKYVDTYQRTAAIGTLDFYVFIANGMFDPNSTGGGHQPMGFDQLMLQYDHYTTTHAKITVTCINVTNVPILFSIHANGHASNLAANPGELMERNRTVYKMVEGTTGGPQTAQLSMNIDLKKFFSQKAIVGEANYRGTSGADPTEKAYFYVGCCDPAGYNAVTANFITKIEYTSVFTEPKQFTQS